MKYIESAQIDELERIIESKNEELEARVEGEEVGYEDGIEGDPYEPWKESVDIVFSADHAHDDFAREINEGSYERALIAKQMIINDISDVLTEESPLQLSDEKFSNIVEATIHDHMEYEREDDLDSDMHTMLSALRMEMSEAFRGASKYNPEPREEQDSFLHRSCETELAKHGLSPLELCAFISKVHMTFNRTISLHMQDVSEEDREKLGFAAAQFIRHVVEHDFYPADFRKRRDEDMEQVSNNLRFALKNGLHYTDAAVDRYVDKLFDETMRRLQEKTQSTQLG